MGLISISLSRLFVKTFTSVPWMIKVGVTTRLIIEIFLNGSQHQVMLLSGRNICKHREEEKSNCEVPRTIFIQAPQTLKFQGNVVLPPHG